MNHHRVLCQASVPVQRVFHFFLRGRVALPGQDLLLEHLGPGAIQVHLFARALVHDFKAVARQLGAGWRCVVERLG